MKHIRLIFILIAFALQSCNNDDCNQECFTPPNGFYFEIVEKTTGENIFSNNSYSSSDLSISNTLNTDEAVEFSFISENELNQIQIGSIGWKTEIVNLKFSLSETEIFNFYVNAERKNGDCCSYTEYKDINITGSEFEYNTQTGIYTILID